MKRDKGQVDNQPFFDALGRAEPAAIRLLSQKISYGVNRAASNAGLPPEDAEELVNDAIVITITNIKEGKFQFMEFSSATYAAGVARKLVANQIRTKKPPSKELDNLPVASDLDPESYLKDKERQSIVGQLLAKLGDTCQQLLKMKYFTHLRDQEIIDRQLAAFTSINSLKSKRSQCLKQLAGIAAEAGIHEMF
ncbi:MAG: sigma-70 family RNA polymerase sigma factor [Lewinellaceae bacterium]|nr:sigma-70 family RNA polymerase sigma factor [Saprospiraceae bacterium]MCB9340053.1 sigma-70 family RNA polymerase sigma factor [Lewinellaceae bacterium]